MSNLPCATDSELSQEDQQLLEIGKIQKNNSRIWNCYFSKPGDIVAVAYPCGDAAKYVEVVTASSATIGEAIRRRITFNCLVKEWGIA